MKSLEPLFIFALGILAIVMSQGCATFTTPIRDCKTLCQSIPLAYCKTLEDECDCAKVRGVSP